jgi:hypothetical protein
MFFALQGIGGTQHEYGSVHPGHGLLQPNQSGTKNIAKYDDDERDNHHQKRQPGDGMTDPDAECIQQLAQNGVPFSSRPIAARKSA